MGRRGLTRSGATLLVIAGLSAGLVACGDDEESGGDKQQTLAVSITGEGKAAKLTGIKDVEGGVVTIDFTNQGKVPADFQLVRVDGNQTVDDVLKITNSDSEGTPIPTWLHGAGGSGGIKPGQTTQSSQVLPEGKYYALASPEGEDENAKPSTVAFEVSGGGEGELAATDATITALEYNFQTSGLKTGKNTITFDNTGKELHHVIAAPILPGKTLEDVKKFASSDGPPSGPPPIDFDNGFSTAVIDGGVKQVTQLDLKKPGKYALLCFIQDRAGGPPHVAKGMLAETTVR